MSAWALRPRHALWLLIATLHMLLATLLVPQAHPPHAPTHQAIALKLLPTPASREPRRDASPVVATAPLLRRPAPRAAAPAVEAAPLPATATAEPQPEPAPPVIADAPPATTAPTTSLLNSEGTRRAIHLATRAPLLSERAASASDAPARETAQQRFGRQVASSAHGNCLKGEFPGGGMGVLSLPFWIAAETSGKCRK